MLDQKQLDIQESRFPVMGTTAHVIVVGGSQAMVAGARARLDELEARWSRFLEDSEVSILNRSTGGPVIVSAETFALISSAVDAWRLTDGRFDPTVAITMQHAGYERPFARLTPDVPNPAVRHTPAPTPTGVMLYPGCSAVQLADGIQLDLGGIAKGTAADTVCAELLSAGAAGCCINIGGDMRMDGLAPRPGGWLVQLDCPGSDQVLDVTIARGAICTSTTRKRRWLGPQGTEHHLREPGTGRPANTGLDTVTVISATATQAEVLAKSALLAGQQDGAAAIERANATGVMVTDAGAVVTLSGLERFLAQANQLLAQTNHVVVG